MMSKCKPVKYAVELAVTILVWPRLHVKVTILIGYLRRIMERREDAIGLPVALRMEGARKLG